jgi:hypothetical protein
MAMMIVWSDAEGVCDICRGGARSMRRVMAMDVLARRETFKVSPSVASGARSSGARSATKAVYALSAFRQRRKDRRDVAAPVNAAGRYHPCRLAAKHSPRDGGAAGASLLSGLQTAAVSSTAFRQAKRSAGLFALGLQADQRGGPVVSVPVRRDNSG